MVQSRSGRVQRLVINRTRTGQRAVGADCRNGLVFGRGRKAGWAGCICLANSGSWAVNWRGIRWLGLVWRLRWAISGLLHRWSIAGFGILLCLCTPSEGNRFLNKPRVGQAQVAHLLGYLLAHRLGFQVGHQIGDQAAMRWRLEVAGLNWFYDSWWQGLVMALLRTFYHLAKVRSANLLGLLLAPGVGP